MGRLKAFLPLLGLGLLAALLMKLGLDWKALFSGDLGAASRALASASQEPGPAKVALLFLMTALLPFALVPITAVLLATASLLPPASALAVILLGSALHTALSFWLGQRYGLALLAALKLDRSRFYATLKEGAREHGFKMAMLSRSLPVPFCFTGLSAPALGLGFWVTMAGSFVAMLPWAFFYVFFTESVRLGSLRFLVPSLGLLGLIALGLAMARRGLLKGGPALPEGLLEPQSPPLGPELTLYTLPRHEPCEDARRELWALRGRLNFEVRELDISSSPDLDAQFHDHVPVVFLGEQKIFSFQVDENALAQTLRKYARD